MTTFPAQQNLATKSKWIAEIPFGTIFSDIKSNINLNLVKFAIPGVNLNPVDVSYGGYPASVPSRVQTPESKEVNIEYILSSDYNQYILLQRWLNSSVTNKFVNSENLYETANAFDNAVKLPIFITLLSEFKTEIFRVKFHNCFLVKVAPLEMAYDSAEDEVLKHNFTFSFTHYTFEL